MTKEERTKKKGSFRICFDLSACNLLDKANRYNIYLIVRAVENDLTEYEVGGNNTSLKFTEQPRQGQFFHSSVLSVKLEHDDMHPNQVR